jgi:nitrogen fixation/metabolism regulation signal transduction histidine kinase
VFIFPNTTAQLAITCLLAAGAVVLVLWWSPHADPMDARIYVLGASIVFLGLFLSLLVKVQSGADRTFQGSDTYSMTLVILNLLMVLAAVPQLMLVGKRAWLSKQTSFMSLRSTTTVSTSSAIGDSVIGTSTKNMSSQDRAIAPTYSTTSPIHRHSSACLIASADATGTTDHDSADKSTDDIKLL